MLEEILNEIKKKGGITKAFLDYDGTLVNITTDPALATPDENLLSILRRLSSVVPTYLVTGRSLADLLGLVGPGFNVIAMHGAQFCDQDGNKDEIENFEFYVKRSKEIAFKYGYLKSLFPGLVIKDKGGGVMFHYYHVSKDKWDILTREIGSIREDGFELYSGKYIFELRIRGINKGTAIKNRMIPGDFIVFAGDDNTDEEAFKMLEQHITIKVGEGFTNARFRLSSPLDIRQLLLRIITDKAFRVNI
ncbi:MAG: trehalose-phosphatase [Thermoplasmatales archaeon]